MGLQFDRVAYSSDSSLTLLVDDFARERGPTPMALDASIDLQDWYNALLLQSAPLIHSTTGRANLEAWLEQVQALDVA